MGSKYLVSSLGEFAEAGLRGREVKDVRYKPVEFDGWAQRH